MEKNFKIFFPPKTFNKAGSTKSFVIARKISALESFVFFVFRENCRTLFSQTQKISINQLPEFLLRMKPNFLFEGEQNRFGQVIIMKKKNFIKIVFLLIGGIYCDTPIFAASPGALDSSFGVAGEISTNILGIERFGDLAVQDDGKIVVVGANDSNDFVVVRYLSNGQLDASFGGDGIVLTDFDNLPDAAICIAIQIDGKIVVGGYTDGTNRDIAIARYNEIGTLDTSFGTGGKFTAIIANDGSTEAINDIALQNDGKIVFAGDTGGDAFIARLNSNGTFDTTFGVGGIRRTDFDINNGFNKIAIRADGRIMAVGATGAPTDSLIARYTSNGLLDTTFSSDGFDRVNGEPNQEEFNSVAVQSNNFVISVGTSSSSRRTYITRHTSSGVLDTTFNTTGIVRLDLSLTAGFDVKIQSDGKILIAALSGTSLSDAADITIFRLNTNGSIDTTFGLNGVVKTNNDNGSQSTCAFLLVGCGAVLVGDKLVVGSSANNGTDFGVARFNLSAMSTTSGDFDGDGISDTAVFRPSVGQWFILRSSDNSFSAQQFGTNGDVPIDGDFDGDGKNDLAVYRPSSGEWFFQRSSNNSFFGVAFGTGADKPIPGDYDKDGKTDIAVFRPSSGSWFYLRSSSNFAAFSATTFGQNGDIPIVRQGS